MRTAQPSAFSKQTKNSTTFSALGWDFAELGPYDRQGLQIMAKAGNTMNYSANLQILPDQGLVIAMTISGSAGSESLTRPILLGLLRDRQLAPAESNTPSLPGAPQTVSAELRKFAGTYVGPGFGVVSITFSPDGKQAVIAPLPRTTDEAAPPSLFTLTHRDGVFDDDAGGMARCYFKTIDAKNYFILTPHPPAKDSATLFGADQLLFEEVPTLREPQALPLEANWLLRTLPAWSDLREMELVLNPFTYKGLAGYVDFGGLKKVESPSLARSAATLSRDQTQLDLYARDGTPWARLGIEHYSGAPPAGSRPGLNTVSIGPKGYNEWLKVQDDSVVSVSVPDKGRVLILKPSQELLFDSLLERQEVLAPKGSLILCAGPAGAAFPITLR